VFRFCIDRSLGVSPLDDMSITCKATTAAMDISSRARNWASRRGRPILERVRASELSSLNAILTNTVRVESDPGKSVRNELVVRNRSAP
jgi:hypothetical protein